MAPLTSLNWETGTWSDPAAGDTEVVLCVAGDWAPIRQFQPIVEKAPHAIYGDLLPIIRAADLSIVNLEAPLSDGGTAVHKSGAVFKGLQAHVNGLAVVPFDVVTLANNHMFDFGLDAFQDSLRALDRNQIQYTGAGMSEEDAARPLVVEVKGIRIGIVNFSEGEDLTAAQGDQPGVMGWDIRTVTQTIQALKKSVDFVLAISHCGIEYIPFPPPYVAKAFQQVADAGADWVIGHHPHVPQGIAFHNQTPICYSLGNFVFYQETDLKYRKLGYMVEIGINKHATVSLKLVPYRIGPQNLTALTGEDAKVFFNKLKAVSTPLQDPQLFEDTWHGFLDYYGTAGFLEEITMILEKLKQTPQKGAAMFRNRLTTPQHHRHWTDLMSRIVNGRMQTSHDWAKNLVEEWLTTTIENP